MPIYTYNLHHLPHNRRVEEAFVIMLTDTNYPLQIFAGSNREIVAEPSRVTVSCKELFPVIPNGPIYYATLEILLVTNMDEVPDNDRIYHWRHVLDTLMTASSNADRYFDDYKIRVSGFSITDMTETSEGNYTGDMVTLRAGIQVTPTS